MAEEDKLAHDLYVTFAAKYETTSFSRISNAETCHLTEVRIVLTRYSITDPMTGKAVGTFAPVEQFGGCTTSWWPSARRAWTPRMRPHARSRRPTSPI